LAAVSEDAVVEVEVEVEGAVVVTGTTANQVAPTVPAEAMVDTMVGEGDTEGDHHLVVVVVVVMVEAETATAMAGPAGGEKRPLSKIMQIFHRHSLFLTAALQTHYRSGLMKTII